MEKFDWKQTIHTNILKLKFVGLWPKGESYTSKTYMLWTIIAQGVFVCGHNFFQTVNLIFIFDDLKAITSTSFITLSTLIAILKAYYVVKNMEILKQLMTTLTSDLFRPRNKRQVDIIQPSLKFWKINYIMYWSMASGAIFFWSTYPILDNSVKEYRLPFLAWYPYNVKISPNYQITYIYQIIGVIFVATTALSVDTLISALNMYIGAQFDILCDDIRHLFDVPDVKAKLISCVEHHRQILEFAENSNNFFNWIVFGQFFISATSIGITMFQLTIVVPLTSEFFSLVSFGLAIVVEIFMYCWFGNEVEVKSNQIPYAVFESNWTKASIELKKNLIILVIRCQRPLKISALNLFYLSLETFVKILRTAWSYFALLHQVSSNKY